MLACLFMMFHRDPADSNHNFATIRLFSLLLFHFQVVKANIDVQKHVCLLVHCIPSRSANLDHNLATVRLFSLLPPHSQVVKAGIDVKNTLSSYCSTMHNNPTVLTLILQSQVV